MQQREMISLPAEAARPPPHQQGRGGQRPGQLRPRRARTRRARRRTRRCP